MNTRVLLIGCLYIGSLITHLSGASIDHQAASPSEERAQPLHEAAKLGDIEHLTLALSEGHDINACAEDRIRPLHCAVTAHQLNAATYLLNQGARVHVADKAGNTPLSTARAHKHKPLIDLLESKILSLSVTNKVLAQRDKHFIILIASYNNERWYRTNLSSVFNQSYRNYTVIYLDDVSKDKTYSKVKAYIMKKNKATQCVLVKNEQKKYCLGNYVWAIERFCPRDAVIITLDGDDWFADTEVLSYLNELYKDPAVWMTYGDSVIYPTNRKTPHCKAISSKLFASKGALRKSFIGKTTWPVHHVRSFYAWLFMLIDQKDFIDTNGKFYTYAEDVAYMLPMLEMAGYQHHRYVAKILYVYNQVNPLITARTRGITAVTNKFLQICRKEPYEELSAPYGA